MKIFWRPYICTLSISAAGIFFFTVFFQSTTRANYVISIVIAYFAYM